MTDTPHPSGSSFPPPPPVRPNVEEYVKAFDKPLTTDEKAAWLAEIVYLVLHGVLPQEVYPALKDKIEALPTIEPSKDRVEEKLPGSDYVHPGPPKPLTATTTVFPNAMPLHEYEHRKTLRMKDASSGSWLPFIILVGILAVIAYGIGTWTMNSTKLIRETPQPIDVAVPAAVDKIATDTPKPDKPLENPFEDPALTVAASEAENHGPTFGPELLAVTDFKDGSLPSIPQFNQHDNKTVAWWLDREKKIKIKQEIKNDTLVFQGEGLGEIGRGMPVLAFDKFAVRTGTRYRLVLDMRCDQPETLSARLVRGNPFQEVARDIQFSIDDEWRQIEVDFVGDRDEENGALELRRFKGGRVYELKRISLREMIAPSGVTENPFEDPTLAGKSPTERGFGPELLRITDFKNGFVPMSKDRTSQKQGGASWFWLGDVKADIRNLGDSLSVTRISGDTAYRPELHFALPQIKKGKTYCFSIEIRGNDTSSYGIAIRQDHPPYDLVAGKDFSLEPQWKTYHIDLTAKMDEGKAKLSLVPTTKKCSYELRRVSLREILDDEDLKKTPTERRYGPELLSVTDFKNGYVPRIPELDISLTESAWFGCRGETVASENNNGTLVFKCERIDQTVLWSPFLCFRPGAIQVDRKYLLELDIRSDKPSSIKVRLVRDGQPLTDQSTLSIGKEWQQIKTELKTMASADKVILDVNHFQEGVTYELRHISLREILPAVEMAVTTENPFEDPALTKTPVLGPELIRISTFSNGYRPRWQDHDWHWQEQKQGRQLGTAEGRRGALRLDVQDAIKPESGYASPELFYAPFSLESGKKYRVEIEMRCEKPAEIQVGVSSQSPHWHGFVVWKKLLIGKDWTYIRRDFTASETRDRSRLHFSMFDAGNVYELRKASICEIIE